MLTTLTLLTVLSQTLPNGATGGAFLVKDDGDFVVLKLRFGERELDKQPKPKSAVKLAAAITLFDSKGALVTLGKPKFTYQFTCENDGGVQHQAIAEVRVAKKNFARALIPAKAGWNLVGFAVVGTVAKAAPIKTEIVYFTADLDGDGTPDAALEGGPDEAMNCGEETGTHFSVNLRNGGGTTRLRCCGP